MRKTLVAILLALAIILSFSISVLAAPAGKPSVTKSPAPEVEEIVVVDKNGEVVKELDASTVTITPVDEADSEDTPKEVSNRLEAAYEQLSSVDSVAELPGEDVGKTIDKEYGEGAADKLAVRELFDLQFSEEYSDYLKAGNTVTIKFNANISKTERLVVLVNYGGNNWKMIEAKNVVVNDDGTVSITFDEAISGPIAFLVDETPLAAPPSSDDEGDGRCPCWHCIHVWPCLCRLICDHCVNWPFCPCWLIVLICIIITIIIIVKIIKKIFKKDEEKKDKNNK